MVSLEAAKSASRSIDAPSSPRISFSAEFLDENNFISITPHPPRGEIDEQEAEREKEKPRNVDFEFLLSSNVSSDSLSTADELFFNGKLLPFWQMQQSEKLNKISLKAKDGEAGDGEEEALMEVKNSNHKNNNNNNNNNNNEAESRVNWFLDDDPSPRPPKCTVLWKELLRLKKQRASSLSPSSSSSSTSSSSSSLADMATREGKEGKEGKESSGNREKHVKRFKKGLERTRSASIRIRPMINLPICTQVKSNSLPPLFPLKKQGRLER